MYLHTERVDSNSFLFYFAVVCLGVIFSEHGPSVLKECSISS